MKTLTRRAGRLSQGSSTRRSGNPPGRIAEELNDKDQNQPERRRPRGSGEIMHGHRRARGKQHVPPTLAGQNGVFAVVHEFIRLVKPQINADEHRLLFSNLLLLSAFIRVHLRFQNY